MLWRDYAVLRWNNGALPGNSVFSFSRSASPLHHTVAVLAPGVELETVPQECYIKATIGGVEYNVISPLVGPDNVPHGNSSGDTATFSSFVGPGTYPNPPGTGAMSLQKDFLYHSTTSSEADFKEFFKPGVYPFVPNRCVFNRFPGIILFWNDDDDQSWETFPDLADQTGSFFKIVGIEDGHDSNGIYFVKVKSRFNCKLYLYASNEMKELVNGEMVSYFKRRTN